MTNTIIEILKKYKFHTTADTKTTGRISTPPTMTMRPSKSEMEILRANRELTIKTLFQLEAEKAEIEMNKAKETVQKLYSEQIAKAKKTGKKVEVETEVVECQSKHEECDHDIMTLWVDGEGNFTRTYIHTW